MTMHTQLILRVAVRCLTTLAICAIPGTAAHSQATADSLLACFVPKSGTMYIVGQGNAPTTCRASDHVLLRWNVAGQQGVPGPAGPPGPAGSLTGSKVLSDFQRVRITATVANPGNGAPAVVVASCPVGKVAISGGYVNLPASVPFGASGPMMPILTLHASYPYAAYGFSTRDWVFQFRYLTAAFAPVTIDLLVMCATER